MAFIIYNIETTKTIKKLVSGRAYFTREFETEQGAKSYLSRLANQGKIDKAAYAVAEESEFYRSIEKQETKQNLMSGGEFSQGVNTPLCCDPSSETYWSM
jgi:hypothetical protein